MDKNFQYYNNRDKYKGICVPSRKGEILDYLIKSNFLSEFSTDEEKRQVLYNLGILQKIDTLLNLLDNKVNASQLSNYVTLSYFLTKIDELRPKDGKAKGYFSSLEALVQKYPEGEDGDWAIVNSDNNWNIYRYNETEGWTQSNETYDTTMDLSEYQKLLISGENIKTINGESILGEGNIDILTDLEGLATKEDLESCATKEDLELYVSKEELYNIQNPLKVNVNISATLLEYTGQPQRVRITAQAKKGNSNVNVDSYQISYDSISELFSGIYETTVQSKGITTFNVSCTLGGETAIGKVQVNLVTPTYLGFYNTSDYNEVNTSTFIKKIKDSITMSETIENTIPGSYLWIVTPLTVNSVATDPGFTYKVEMILAGTIDGIKYYRSNSAIDISNLTYYIK